MANDAAYVKELLELEKDQLTPVINALREEPFASQPDLKQLRIKLRLISLCINNMANNSFEGLVKDDIDEFGAAFEYVRDFIPQLLNMKGNSFAGLSNLQQLIKPFYTELQKEGNQYDKVYKTFVDYYKFIEDTHSGKIEDDIKKARENKNVNGVRPSIDEILYLQPTKDNVQKILDISVWLAACEAEYSSLHKNLPYGNFYYDNFARISLAIQDAPYDVQAEYAKELLIREAALEDLAYAKYQEYLSNSTSDPKEKDAMVELYKSKEYQNCAAFNNNFKQMLTVAATGYFFMWPEEVPKTKDEASLTTRKSAVISRFINGGMKTFFVQNNLPYGGRVNEFVVGAAAEDLKKSGYVHTPELDAVVKEYINFQNDKEKASESYQYMKSTLTALMNHDPSDLKSDKYEYLLNTALDAAQQYSLAHKGYRFTDNGKARQASALNLEDNLKKLHDQYEIRVGKKHDFKDYENSGKVYQAFFNDLLNKNAKTDVTVDELVSMVQSHRVAAPDTNTFIKKDKADLVIPDKDRSARKALSLKAEANFIKTYDKLQTVVRHIRQGIEIGELKEDNVKEFLDRDFPHLLLDHGYDSKTVSKNINTIRLLSSPTEKEGKKDELLGKYINERLEKLLKVDYEKYTNLSDEDLVNNFDEICQALLPIATLEDDLKHVKDNEFVNSDTVNKALKVVNEYSSLYYNIIGRMEYIASPCYEVLNTEKLFKDPDTVTDLLLNDNNHIQRFSNSMSSSRDGKASFIADRIRAAIVNDPANKNDFNAVAFFDAKGQPLKDLDIIKHVEAGESILAVSQLDPTIIKECTLDANLKVTTKEPTLDENKLEEIFQNQLRLGYKKIVSDKLSTLVYEDGTYSEAIRHAYSDMGDYFFSKKASQLGCPLSDNPKLRNVFNDISRGKSVEEIKANPDFAEYKEHIDALYKAGFVDVRYKNLRENAISEQLDLFTTKRPNLKALNETIDKMNLPRITDPKKQKELQKELIFQMKSFRAEINDGTSTSNRAFAIKKYDPRLTKEEKIKVSEDSRTFEGRKEIIRDIVDDVLSLDLNYIENLSMDNLVNEYGKISYMQNMVLDYSYIDNFSKEAKGVLTPYEYKVYREYIEYATTPLNGMSIYADLSVSEIGNIVDVEKITYNQALQLYQEDHANSNFWSKLLPAKMYAMNEEARTKGHNAYNEILESRWVNALLAKDGLDENEIEMINSFNNEPDRARGRAGLYAYAVQRIFSAANEKSDNMTPEKASYLKLMGQAGKYLMTQMKNDGYELDPETSDALNNVCKDLNKIKADVVIALDKGRSLNEKAVRLEKQFHLEQVEKKRNELVEKAKTEEKTYIKAMQKAVKEKKFDEYIEHGSKVLYLNSLETQIANAPEEKITNFPIVATLASGDTALKFKEDFKKFVEINKDIIQSSKAKLDKDQIVKAFDDFQKTGKAMGQPKKEEVVKHENEPKVDPMVRK